MTRHALLYPVLLLLWPAHAVAQMAGKPHYVIDRWTTDTGLPQSSVNAVLQSRNGYLWLGTYGGVTRFDGNTFSPVPALAGRTANANRTRALAQDDSGRIWIGTEHGLIIADRGHSRTLTTENGLAHDVISALLAQGSRMWYGTSNGGLGYVQGDRTRIVVRPNTRFGNGVYRLIADSSGNVWVAAANGTWRVGDSAISLVTVEGRRIAELLFADPARGVWVTDQNTLRHIADDTVVAHTRTFNALPGAAAVTATGDLWITTNNEYLWHLRAGHFDEAPEGIHVPDLGDPVQVVIDREDNVWLGSATGGLFRARPALFTALTKRDGLATDVSAGIFADSHGRVWAGTTCSGVSIISSDGIRVLDAKRGIRHGCVWSLAEDNDGSMWLGTWGGGLAHWQEGSPVRWYLTQDGLPSNAVLALLRARDQTLWIGTEGGLAARKDGRFVQYHMRDGLVHESIRTLTQTRDGAIWIGTEGGLSRLHDGRFTNYTTANGLPNNYVRAIYEDEAGTLWIGTYGGGLVRMKNGSMTTITTDDGLFDNVISSIIEDAAGNLWFGCNRGVFRVARRDLEEHADDRSHRIHSVVYGTIDGMASAETNGGFTPAVARTPDGRLWYPTMKGIAVVDPRAATTNVIPPAVVLEQAIVNGEPRAGAQSLRVGPGAAELEFAYSGLSYSAPNAVTFRYKLDGWDEGWVDAGSRRSVHYARVAPGRYSFLVAAANRDGVWSVPRAIASVEVLPHFWSTWWFRLLLLTSLCGALWLLVQLRIHRLRKAHARQQEFSQRLIAREEQERKRIAGELHDSLGQDLLVLKNRALIALRSQDDAERSQSELAQINEIVSDAIQNVRNIAQNLRPYQIDRLGLTVALRSAVNKVAEGANVEFIAEIDDVDGLFAPEAEINLFRILQESLNNILKHSGATQARIRLKRNGEGIELAISDNGHGFAFTREQQARAGLGLSGLQERAQIVGGKFSLDSAPQRGTTLTFTIPVTAWTGSSSS